MRTNFINHFILADRVRHRKNDTYSLIWRCNRASSGIAFITLNILKLSWLASGAQALLGELMLYFMPVLIAVVQYKALFAAEGWQLIISIVIGTFLVMSSTALTLKYCYRLRRAWIKHRHI